MMGERTKIFLRDECDGSYEIISITPDQKRLLEWLYQNAWLKDDVNYSSFENAQYVEI